MTTLSIIVPAYNEKHTIGEILSKIERVDFAAFGASAEIIIIDDASQDGTRELLQKLPAQPHVSVLYHKHNRG
ncbi:glycosyltransferase, partial [candidate division KSB1 bacterium]|nr:glycosyltransferase [candidate division KSB1 bacterium]